MCSGELWLYSVAVSVVESGTRSFPIAADRRPHHQRQPHQRPLQQRTRQTRPYEAR